MKKLLALALVVFGLAACQTEPEGLDVQMGGEQEVMLTVSLPETTRANSAQGAFGNVNWDTYTLRYILEIYRVENKQVLYNTCQRFVETSDGTSMVFPVRLAPGYNYRVAAWADIVSDNGEKADRCYNTQNGLDSIAIIDNMWKPMDETRDAYTGLKIIEEFGNQSQSTNFNIELKRPFAKVRVVATDIADIRKVGLEPVAATMSYSDEMYRVFNAVADTENYESDRSEDEERKNIEYTYAQNYYEAYSKEDNAELTLFTDYIFVPQDGTAQFTLNVYADTDKTQLIKSNAFNTEICVERNKLTTIKGDVLTIGGDVKVEVNGTLEEGKTYTYVDTAEDLQAKINNIPENGNANIKLGGDIDLSKLLGATTLSTRSAEVLPFVIAEGKTLVLDLNGFTISTPLQKGSETNHYYAFENYGTLTIKDSSEGKTGEIIARGNFNYGSMTLESGKINACDHNGGYGVRNYKGTFTMNGGTIVASNENGDDRVSGNYDASPLRVDANATATIKGGNITNVSNYTVAIDNYGTTTIEGGTFTSVHSTIANAGTMTIKGDATTIKCEGEYTSAHPIYANGEASNTYVNGGNFIGNNKASCYYVAAEKNTNVYISGGIFTNAGQAAFTGEGNIVVTGGQFDKDPSKFVDDNYSAVEGTDGKWTVAKKSAAKIGDTIYYDLSEALAAAKAGDTVIMMNDVTLSEECSLPAGITFNGNGKQINGSIYAGGDITFVGHTKVTSFSASYYNRTITIAEGACLEVTGTGRVTLGYGNTFNITGSIDNAKTADKASIQPSLIIPAGISITGGNNATMNVTNAYVQIGSTTSKPGAADGKFTFNFENSIAEFTKEFGFYEPTGGKTPEFEMNITNSVFTTAAKLCVAATNSEIVVDNSVVTLGTYLRNSGVIALMNGSVMTGSTIQFGENGGNNGTINVDASTFTITASSTGHAFDGQNIGKINATNGATVSVDYYKAMTINVDATSTFTGVDVDANKKIYYTGDMKLVPTNEGAFGGAAIVSNEFKNGKGVITFDRDVTTIGDEAFYRESNQTPSNWMTSITLPESVKTIGNYAFYQCYSLKTINIPDSVTSIGEYAFSGCNAVTTVTIGSGVKSIGSSAFYNCYVIKEIICKPYEAPALADKWVFYGVDEVANVYVPAASVDTYKAAWSMFADKIVAGEF